MRKRKQKGGSRPKIKVAGLNVIELIRLRDALNAEVARRRTLAEQQVRQLDRMVSGGKPQPFMGPRLVAHTNKVPPKYRDPKTGTTWAGRGGMPKWMRAAIKAGAKREQFLIKRAA